MERISVIPKNLAETPIHGFPAQATLFLRNKSSSSEVSDIVSRKSAFGVLSYEPLKQQVLLDGRRLSLSPKETKFLGYLITKGCFVTTTEVAIVMYPEENRNMNVQHDLRIHNCVALIRRKLGKDFITSKSDEGYCLNYGGDTPSLLSDAYEIGHLVISPSAHRLEYQDNIIDLTPMEFKIFEYLLARREFVPLKDIVSNIWPDKTKNNLTHKANCIMTWINNLRKKLGADMIQSERLVGYNLIVPGDNRIEFFQKQDNSGIGEFDTVTHDSTRLPAGITPSMKIYIRRFCQNKYYTEEDSFPPFDMSDPITRETEYGEISLDIITSQLFFSGQELILPDTEMRIFSYLVIKGTYASIREICGVLWPCELPEMIGNRSKQVYVSINNLRKQLSPGLIVHSYPAGYAIKLNGDYSADIFDEENIGEYTLYPSAFHVKFRDTLISLNGREYQLFEYLLRHEYYIPLGEMRQILWPEESSTCQDPNRDQQVYLLIYQLQSKFGLNRIIHKRKSYYALNHGKEIPEKIPDYSQEIKIDDIYLYPSSSQVRYGDRLLTFTQEEFLFISALSRQPNQLVNLTSLYSILGKKSYQVYYLAKNIMKRFREIFGDDNPVVHTRGEGYILNSKRNSVS